MIISISTNKNNVKATVSPHFARCEWFCLLNTDTKEYSFIENPLFNQQNHVGPHVVELLIKKGISAVIAGRFGAKVIDTLIKQNIQMIIPDSSKTIAKIINQLK
jgi:Uncharacterized conserved protein